MFARFIAPALILVALALGGCAHRVTTTVGPDGTRSTTSETRWVPSTYVAPLIYAPPYGRDHYSNGPFSYDPAVPAPHVIFGEMVSGTMREAIVNGTRRMCDVRPTAPNYCNRIMDAYSWPTLTSGWRR